MGISGTSTERRRRVRLAMALGILAILGAAAWAAVMAGRMREREVQSVHALADLHRMRHTTRALLSARRPLSDLAAGWNEAVAGFSRSFTALAQTSGCERLVGLAGSWQRIQAEVVPVQAAVTALISGPLASQVGDEGVEQTAARLLMDRHATAELLELRRLQRHLGAFDVMTEDFAARLEVEATGIAQGAIAATRLASACAVLLLLGAVAVGAWLLLRISLLNVHLSGALRSLEKAQAESAHREQVLRAVLDGLGEGVILIDADGLLVWANPAARQLAGPDADLKPGVAWRGLLELRDREGQALHPAPGDQPHRWLDAQLRHGRGEVRIDLGIAPVQTTGDRPGLVVVCVDLTARRILEEQLRRAQSLEALGRLAGGVAHDFNNLLAGILGNAEMLGTRLADRPQLRERVDTIITAGSRAAVLTRQLLDSARRSAMQRGKVDLHQLVRDSVILLGRSLDRRIEIGTELLAQNPWIEGDAALMQNALVNLAINARDAMTEGGRLLISTAEVRAPVDAKGTWLELRMTDTGCGIPEDVLPHIFEAFFTTKPVGKGSGLGLAAVQGTVIRHGGRIAVESRTGVGTTVIIQLPSCMAPATEAHARSEVRTPRPGLRILLIDDEEIVRSMAADQLRELGYHVHPVGDGAEAVAILRAEPKGFDGVVLDLVMPRQGGIETLHALRVIRPDLPILFWSGYSAGHDVESLLKDGQTAFIAKPATHAALGKALATLLG